MYQLAQKNAGIPADLYYNTYVGSSEVRKPVEPFDPTADYLRQHPDARLQAPPTVSYPAVPPRHDRTPVPASAAQRVITELRDRERARETGQTTVKGFRRLVASTRKPPLRCKPRRIGKGRGQEPEGRVTR